MSTIRTRTIALVAVAGLALGQVVLVATTAEAKGGDNTRVVKTGSCSERGTWKLKAKHDDGKIEWELEVDTNKRGQKFAVKVTDNGATVFAGTRTTAGPSGSFAVGRSSADLSGKDVLRAVAVRGDNVCKASVTL